MDPHWDPLHIDTHPRRQCDISLVSLEISRCDEMDPVYSEFGLPPSRLQLLPLGQGLAERTL